MMDWTIIFIGFGLIFTGVIIGYPLGHLFAKREFYQKTGDPTVIVKCRNCVERDANYWAEVIE